MTSKFFAANASGFLTKACQDIAVACAQTIGCLKNMNCPLMNVAAASALVIRARANWNACLVISIGPARVLVIIAGTKTLCWISSQTSFALTRSVGCQCSTKLRDTARSPAFMFNHSAVKRLASACRYFSSMVVSHGIGFFSLVAALNMTRYSFLAALRLFLAATSVSRMNGSSVIDCALLPLNNRSPVVPIPTSLSVRLHTSFSARW